MLDGKEHEFDAEPCFNSVQVSMAIVKHVKRGKRQGLSAAQ
jgi:hypothetical protein